MQATARITFYRAPDRLTVDGLAPVKLCVTHERKRRYYSIQEHLKKNEWNFIELSEITEGEKTGKTNYEKATRGELKDRRNEYDRIVRIAETIIEGIPMFSFNQFEDRYFNRITNWDNFFEATWNHAKELRSEGRFGYASSFECMLKAVKEFHDGRTFEFKRADKVATRETVYLKGKSLRFIDISPEWLKRFEKWMQESIHGKKKDKPLSRSTQGIYVRNIRVLFNLAIKKHEVQAPYPFTEHKPKKAKGRKLALSAEQISLIANYQTEHPLEKLYRDIFMFSFFANGMNIADIVRLKYSNIKGSEISFVREKTKLEEDTEEAIHVVITPAMQNIIDRQGNKAVGHDAYLFPFLKPTWTDEQCFYYIKGFIKEMNKSLKRVARTVGIEENISTYTARHSFATISKNSGASVEFISEALGHSSVKVTAGYLKQFEDTTRREHAKKMEDLIYNNKAV